MPERWTRAVLRMRAGIVLAWCLLGAGGAYAATQLPSLLSSSFAVPGTSSDRAAGLLAAHFGERPEGSFIVVFRVPKPSSRSVQRRLQRRLDRAAAAIPGGHALTVRPGGGIVYGEVATRLELQQAKRYTDALRRALRSTSGPAGLVTGQPAIQHDLDPVLSSDLRRGELLAVPVALVVLLTVFGASLALVIPFLVAAATIATTLLVVYAAAHALATTSFVTNVVALIGLGLAVDYSLLIVHRFREELRGGAGRDEAIARTMSTAGRTVVFSGAAVAIGLGVLLVVPVPFIRSLGLGAALVPLVSVAAALTLQPVLLMGLGSRALRGRVPAADGRLFWERAARFVVRRRLPVLALAVAALVALASPLLWLRLVPGSFSGIPAAPESARALALLRDGVGPGALTPTEIVVDTRAAGRARSGPAQRAIRRLSDELAHDPEVLLVASGVHPPYVDASARYGRVVVVGRSEYGSPHERALVDRLRDALVPAAGFPAGAVVETGGAPPQGADFMATTYSAFPWLVLGVVAVSLLTLVAAFRSLLLPLSAVVLNLLSVAAAYGVLVLVFEWGAGTGLLGLQKAGHVEGWVPILLFATLFGLSMDYEVFLVMRIREAWANGRDTVRAVELGLERTGRVVTAAALIMAGAFAGFVFGRVPGLQQLGVGLAAAVLLDAAVVRALVVPALIAVLGPRSWWLPRARTTPA